MISVPLRCQVCDDLIGTYEPLIVWADGSVRETSRIVDRHLPEAGGEHYHSACYRARFEELEISAARERARGPRHGPR